MPHMAKLVAVAATKAATPRQTWGCLEVKCSLDVHGITGDCILM